MRVYFASFKRLRKRRQIVFIGLTSFAILSYYFLIYSWGVDEEAAEDISIIVENSRYTTFNSEDRKQVTLYWGRMAYFWGGSDDLQNFFFKGLNIDPYGGLTGVCVGLASSAVLFEGLRKFRDYYLKRFIAKRQTHRLARLKSNSMKNRAKQCRSKPQNAGPSIEVVDAGGGGDMGDVSASLMRTAEEEEDLELEIKTGNNFSQNMSKICQNDRFKYFSLLFMSTLLHFVYISIGYILMLAVMTFNVWILVAIGIGVAIGHFIFGAKKYSDAVVYQNPVEPGCSSDGISPSATATTDLGVHDHFAERSTRVHRNIKPNNLDSGTEGRYYSHSSDSDNTNVGRLTTEIIVHPNAPTTDSP